MSQESVSANPPVAPIGPSGVTPRAIISGLVLALVLCSMNTYLTLSFGVIEEGPTIAALFFFTFFMMSKAKITANEMVIVSTMGSAGGSLGFIANFYAAKSMVATPYSVMDMALFGIVSSLIGLVMVIPLRQILVLKNDLPWPGAKATYSVIKALVTDGDKKQARTLLVTFLLMALYVVGNKEDGFGWWPASLPLPGLAALGGAISLAPFALGGSYLMGMRTCVGFLVGAVTIMVINAAYPPAREFRPVFYWPGLGFLVASGLTMMAINWRSMVAAMRAIFALGGKSEDTDPIMSGRMLTGFAIVAFTATALVLNLRFAVSILITVVMVLVAGFIQNMIATRAQAQTAFNPARVMGILLQGVTSALGGSRADINLTGAGFVAGSGAQAGNLTGDMAYGRWLGERPRRQFWAQALTVVPCAIAAAFVFDKVREVRGVENMAAPVAKMWAEAAKVFDQGFSALPPHAGTALAIGAVIGVVYTLLESRPRLARYMPETVGVGLGLVLWVEMSISFFIGGFLFWIILGRWFKVRDITLTTIAVGCIVAEGIGGVLKPLLKVAGVPGL